MEPAQEPLKKLNIGYTIVTTIMSVAEEFEKVYSPHESGQTILAKGPSLGWFIHFDGSSERLYFGDTKPHFEKGDKVKITFAKVTP